MVRRQDASEVRLHDAVQEPCSDVSKVPNRNVSSKSQVKHPMKYCTRFGATSQFIYIASIKRIRKFVKQTLCFFIFFVFCHCATHTHTGYLFIYI